MQFYGSYGYKMQTGILFGLICLTKYIKYE
jgi:hypothetical protein